MASVTSPAGSIGIGVSVDASDLDTQITRAVQSAMRDVIAEVREGMGDTEKVFGSVDLSAFHKEVLRETRATGRDMRAEMRRTLDKIEADSERTGRNSGRSFGRGFASGMRTGLRGVAAGFGVINAGILNMSRHVGTISSVAGVASRVIRGFSLATVGASVAARALSGGLRGLSRVLTAVGAVAGHVAREISRVTSALLVLQAVARVSKAMTGFARAMSKVTIGAALALGTISGLSTLISGPLIAAATAGAAALGALAGAAVGLAGPALAVLKLGFSGLADGAKEFNEQFKEVDKAFSEMIGQRMAPLLGSFRDLRMEITDTFSAALTPAFSTLGGLIDGLRPQLAGLSEILGQIGVDIADSLAGPAAVQGFQAMIDASQTFFSALTGAESGLGGLASGFVSFLGNAATAFQGASVGVNEFFLNLGEKLRSISVEEIRGAVDTIRQMFTNIGNVAGPIIDVFRQVGAVGAQSLGPAFSAIGTAIADATPGLVNMATILMPALGDVVERLAPLLPALVQAFTPWAEVLAVIAPVLADLVAFLGPFAPILLGIALAVKGISAAMVVWNAATAAASVAQGIFAAATGRSAATLGANTIALTAHRIALLAGAAASSIAAGATAALGAAMRLLAANPIILVITAIVAALALFFTKTELGRQIFDQLKIAIMAAWEGIKVAIAAAWTFIQPILQALWSFITGTLVPAFTFLWTGVIQPAFAAIGSIISLWWNNIVKPVFGFLVGFIINVVVPAIQRFWADVMQAFNAVGGLISLWWNNIVKPVFNFLVGFLQTVLIPAVLFLWHNVFVPVFNGIGAAISFWWNSLVKPIFGFFVGFLNNVLIPVLNFLWHNVVKPVFDGIGATISFVWTNVIRPAFDALKGGVSSVGDFFSSVVGGIGRVWDGLRSLLAKPINFMIGTVYNNGIRKAWNTIEKFIPGIDAAPELPLIPEHYTGGRIGGAKGRDNVLMWGSDNEHMLTVSDVLKAGGHDTVYAIRDMIQRGIPFEWDNGAIIPKLGAANLSAYGNAVQMKGLGQVDPQGLFDPVLPKFYRGGKVTLPWERQLEAGHRFARPQHGKPYQWAGPTGPGSSFDCSGFMGSIAAAILGNNPWQRYWATAGFAGYPPVGPQGFTKGVGPGFTIGVTDDPGGPGGGHTAGVLSRVGSFHTARVESGGALGNVHYGTGTPVGSFDSQYHLPIGANGFFDPGTGGPGGGPSPEQQRGFLKDKITEAFNVVLDPIKSGIASVIGSPPPEYRNIPPSFLDTGRDLLVNGAVGIVGGLSDKLGEAWSLAKDVGSGVLDTLNPFDNGGIANGTGFMPKNVIEPERVLSPQQTKLFEALVSALESVAGGSAAAGGSIVDEIGRSVSSAVGDVVSALAPQRRDASEVADPELVRAVQVQGQAITEQGEILSDTQSLIQRTDSSQAQVAAERQRVLEQRLVDVANRLTGDVLGPVMKTAVSGALGIVSDAITATGQQTVDAQNSTTAAVEGLDSSTGGGKPAPAFGMPGSAFDFGSALADVATKVADTASSAILKIGEDIAQAALEQRTQQIDDPAGTLGDQDNSGGFLVDTLVRLTGVEIQIRDTMAALGEDIREFRGDEIAAFTTTGQLISDTASLMERTASSQDLVIAEQNRINRELLKSTLRYLMVKVVLPVMIAAITALITLATTAIGAAIGTAIGGPLGTAIGGAAGAAIGLALSAGAAAAIAGLGLGAGALIDSFDSGGVATGIGVMPKNTIAPERVLSPRQTASFDRLVDALDRPGSGLSGNRTVQVGSMTITGRDPAQRTADNLLSLLNS